MFVLLYGCCGVRGIVGCLEGRDLTGKLEKYGPLSVFHVSHSALISKFFFIKLFYRHDFG